MLNLFLVLSYIYSLLTKNSKLRKEDLKIVFVTKKKRDQQEINSRVP